jgi:membrane fusion protein (multidrug efflux system)
MELYERQARVWKDNVGTQAELLQRQNQMETANARLRMLRTRLEHTQITAPFAGVVDARYVDEGESVTPWAPVLRLIDASRLDIEAGVPERYAADVHVGSVAYVTFDVLPGREFTGTVKFVGGAVDPGNRTFPIEVDLENPDGIIKPEMVANVRVVRHKLEAAIVVPEEALRYTEKGFVAFVAADGERGAIAEERHVRVGPSYANRTVVESGLRAGDRLITRGQLQVAAGSRIEIAATESTQP